MKTFIGTQSPTATRIKKIEQMKTLVLNPNQAGMSIEVKKPCGAAAAGM
jgi:hypothetical protein